MARRRIIGGNNSVSDSYWNEQGEVEKVVCGVVSGRKNNSEIGAGGFLESGSGVNQEFLIRLFLCGRIHRLHKYSPYI